MGKSKGKWILDIFGMSKNEKGLKTFEKTYFVTEMNFYGVMPKKSFYFCYDNFLYIFLKII